MNSPRVNLLKKSEQRYQGVVSRRFISVSLVITPILLVAVLSGVKLVQYTGTQAQLKSSRALWAELEPRLSLYKDKQRGLTANGKIAGMFDDWQASQHGSFVELLDDIRDTVPEKVQFTRMSVRGTPAAAVYADNGDTAMDYTLVIEGISQGVSAEKQVTRLLKSLQKSDRLTAAFPALKLSSMRKQNRAGEVNTMEFRLEGEAASGGEK